MTEKQLQAQIVHALNLAGCWVWSVNAGKIKIQSQSGIRFFSGAPTGHSDIQGILKKTGQFIAIEVKLPKRRKFITYPQQKFLDQVKESGGISGIATSPDEALAIINQD